MRKVQLVGGLFLIALFFYLGTRYQREVDYPLFDSNVDSKITISDIAWSPDGNQIAYTKAKFAVGAQIATSSVVEKINADGSDGVEVLNCSKLNTLHGWLDGDNLIYSTKCTDPKCPFESCNTREAMLAKWNISHKMQEELLSYGVTGHELSFSKVSLLEQKVLYSDQQVSMLIETTSRVKHKLIWVLPFYHPPTEFAVHPQNHNIVIYNAFAGEYADGKANYSSKLMVTNPVTHPSIEVYDLIDQRACNFQWSPDGSRLLYSISKYPDYCSADFTTYYEFAGIHDVVQSEFTNPREVKMDDKLPDFAIGTFKWSLDSRMVAFQAVYRRDGYHTILVVMDVATGEIKRLTPITDNLIVSDFALSPNGKLLAFSAHTLSYKLSDDLYLIDVDGSNMHKITNYRTEPTLPATETQPRTATPTQ